MRPRHPNQPVPASVIGGYAGAAMARAAFVKGFGHSFQVLIWSGWIKTLIFMVISPLVGFALGYLYITVVYWLFRHSTPKKMDIYFRKLQFFSAAAFSYSHGTNDAQKTMGIVAGTLYTAGILSRFYIPFWVVLMAHAAIALGTMAGGWRIVKTMGMRLTKLRPFGGFCAETGGSLAIFIATSLGIPVSTTHTITGAILGVGSVSNPGRVRWGLASRILWAWLFTIPASAAIAAMTYFIARALGVSR